jgi:hypothetical protein
MSSTDHPEPLDLARDLPTTADDVAILDRLESVPRLTLEAYVRFSRLLGPLAAHALRARPGPAGEPFDLLA